MIRWKYVAPRLLMLVAVAVGIWLGTDSVLRWSLSRSLQAVVGAKVDIGNLQTDLLHGSIHVDKVCVADRDKEFKNLVELERVLLDVEMYAGLRRKLVIRDGRMEGLRFDTKRDESGRLPNVPDTDDRESNPSGSSFGKAGALAQDWMSNQVDGLENQLERDLQTVQLGRELADRWPATYRDMEQQATKIEQQGKQLREQIKIVKGDPLKHLDQVQPLMASVEQLRRDIVTTRDQLSQLQRQMREDQQALKNAKKHDEQYVRERLHLKELDGRSLSEYLLGPIWSERMELAMHWLKRSRDAVPAPAVQHTAQPASRGVSVIFPGFSASPDVLIRQLQLSGEGSVDENPFRFDGVIRDLTHQPRRHSEPTTIELQAEGAIDWMARGTMDRRGDEPIDRFVVDIPALSAT